jgi:predicted nucleic acid-binding protein
VKYLLDTNIISEPRKRERCDANVARWYRAVGEDDAFLSVPVAGEIRKRIERNLGARILNPFEPNRTE